MLLNPLLIFMLILILLWVIRDVFILLVINLFEIFIIIDFTSYFDMAGVTTQAQMNMIYGFVMLSVISWAKLIHILIILQRKGKEMLEEVQ